MTIRGLHRRVPWLGALSFFIANVAMADTADTAHRLYERIAGVPPNTSQLNEVKGHVEAGDLKQAARVAMENPYFYDLTIRNWVSTWTNEAQTARVPLNDMTATIMGVIRDDESFAKVLYDDILYVGSQAGLTPYSGANNQHYQDIEDLRVPIAPLLEKTRQSSTASISDPAGVMTTRGFASAFYNMGTNRAAVRFTFMNFLCKDMENMHDTSRPDYKVRRDVDRSPGGDSKVWLARCKGCHAGMDSLGGAFAYYDFVEEQMVYTPGTVQEKMNRNGNVFEHGYVTESDAWINIWAEGQNAAIGWNGEQSGNGAKSYGELLAGTDQFPVCMATEVYKILCLKSPEGTADEFITSSADAFKKSEFDMKELFAVTAAECLGGEE